MNPALLNTAISAVQEAAENAGLEQDRELLLAVADELREGNVNAAQQLFHSGDTACRDLVADPAVNDPRLKEALNVVLDINFIC